MNKYGSEYVAQDKAAYLTEKWAPILDYSSAAVPELKSDNDRLNTAILLENQEQYCLREQNTAGNGGVFGSAPSQGISAGGIGNTDNYAAGDARLPKVLIPMIRRTFPELITNEIVGVQPMSGPVGLAFALRYKYSDQPLGNGGNANPLDATGDASLNPGLEPQHARYDGTSLAEDELGYGNLDTRYTGTSSDALSGGAVGSPTAGFIAPQDSGVARLLKSFEFTGNIPQVEVSFEKTAVEAGTRRLAAKWSVELEQDVRNMNGIDIDGEMTNAMSYEIQAEIDREMVMRMCQSAINGNNVSVWAAASADGRWLGERTRDFYAKVIVEANRVAVRNRRGAANFIIATPKVCAMFEMLPEYDGMPVNGNVNSSSTGVAKVGTVGGRFTVYRDTRTDAQNIGRANTATSEGQRVNDELEYCLLGYKGAEYYDTGIVYCPYIPVMIQRTIGPNDFSPRVGLLTRYGVVDNLFGADLYYHLMVVQGLGQDFGPGITGNYL